MDDAKDMMLYGLGLDNSYSSYADYKEDMEDFTWENAIGRKGEEDE